MEPKEITQICESLDLLPTAEAIKQIPRGLRYKIVFGNKIKEDRERVGSLWKDALPHFQVGIHTVLNEINILKLITEEEIIAHQDFFEQCAKDYRNLSQKLITTLAKELKVEINPDYPLETLNQYKGNSYKQVGMFNGWRYYFHGFHCGFTNLQTGQNIETPLTYGMEFGELDPYFFSIYINSTNGYHPLPVQIYDDYDDGRRILNKMLEIGKFEKINSNISGDYGVVVKDRERIAVKIYGPISPQIPERDFKVREPTSFWSALKRFWFKYWH